MVSQADTQLDKFDLRPSVADAPHNHVETPEGILNYVGSSISAPGGSTSTDEWYQPVSQPQRSLQWLHPALNPAFFGPDRDGYPTELFPKWV
jgi:hypothetical protein